MADASPRKARVRRWLFDACFPFWAERGPDPRGGFCERLALGGAPICDSQSRVRVQARQTYVFATAAGLGWERDHALELVRRGVKAMLGPCRRPDFLFGKMVHPGRGLADPQPELYDNAFCLLGLAFASVALGDVSLLDEADKTIAALDAALAHPAGGFAESFPPRLPRRQNPHMHLFEAMLALESAGPGRGYRQRADRLLDLFEARILDRAKGAVTETFDDDWTQRKDALIEPGHLFEWAWLLARRADLLGAPLSETPRRLYDTARGFLDPAGFAPQSARIGAGAVDATRRAWPQTEALKAHLALGEMARADALLDAFFSAYLAGVPAGAWRDHFDATGALIATDIPASTGYHIVLAFTEYLRRAH